MRVAQVSFFTDPLDRQPDELLEEWATLIDVAECADIAGARVTVIQASRHRHQLQRNGVNYHFLPYGFEWMSLLRRTDPEVIHVHGLDFPDDVLSLANSMPRVPILLQDHAGRPPQLWRRALWRRAFTVAAGVAFCSLQQALPFAKVSIIHAKMALYEIPESSSRFTPGDQDEARRNSGIAGAPILLWVGHLDANKDPITLLDAVSRAAQILPHLQLYCCYGKAPLLSTVQYRIAQDPWLSGRVHLLGRVPHERIEQLMRAADLFVLASHREGSGYALIEALACGLPPLVTDIASFRALTRDGQVGALWRTGDARRLSECLVSHSAHLSPALRKETRAHFERELSFPAVGRKLAQAYQDVLRRQSGERLIS